MKIISWLRGLFKPHAEAVVPKAVRARKKRAPRAVSHAEAVKIDLLNAVADAIGRAPEEIDESEPTARIAVNGSLFTIPNTVGHLTAFQTRLEKLKTTTRTPGVPLAARKFRPHYTHKPEP